jgi:hypothetical protein
MRFTYFSNKGSIRALSCRPQASSMDGHVCGWQLKGAGSGDRCLQGCTGLLYFLSTMVIHMTGPHLWLPPLQPCLDHWLPAQLSVRHVDDAGTRHSGRGGVGQVLWLKHGLQRGTATM